MHRKAFPGGVFNTLAVARFVRDHAIQVIHSHSRRAHWVAAQVSAMTQIPHVTTIHQPPPIHSFSRLWPCLGDRTIAIDEVIVEFLQTHFRRSTPQICLIRNGICLPSSPASHSRGTQEKRILILGRLSGGRWLAFQFLLTVLERLGKQLPKTDFQIVGRLPEEHAREFIERLSQTNQRIAPSTLVSSGFASDLDSVISGCDGVIAGGRSALESLARGKPVIAMGEGGVLGLCTPETAPEALRTNFGDHLTGHQFFPAKMELALRQLLVNDPILAALSAWGRNLVEQHYNIHGIAKAVEAVYHSL